MPKRIQLSRAKGWRKPPNTVKVDRTSRWGNPFNQSQLAVCFIRGAAGPGLPLVALNAPPSLERCLDLYKAYLRGRMDADHEWLKPLQGKNLACWCKVGDPCHADILLRLANPGDPL